MLLTHRQLQGMAYNWYLSQRPKEHVSLLCLDTKSESSALLGRITRCPQG